MPAGMTEPRSAFAFAVGADQKSHPLASQRSSVSTAEALSALIVCAAVCLLGTYLMGRDLNWDYFNYHAYAALQWRGERIGQDFFAAGVQGYLNPLAYAPLGLMQAAGWHSLSIASALAAIQSLNLFFLFLLCRDLFSDSSRPTVVAASATALGALTPPFWSQVGSTFVDATVAPLVMAAIWMVCKRSDRTGLVVAGFLAGAAVALKWTFAPFALGLWLCVAFTAPTLIKSVRAMLVVGLGIALGFLAFYGYWGWQLSQHHGSPVFPLFNGIFRSPDYPSFSDGFHRYIPQSLGDLLALPFRMAQFDGWIYTEVPAPDIRPALALLLCATGLIALLLKRVRPGSKCQEAESTEAVKWSVLGAFCVVSAAAWVATSTNGRYASPLLLLLGPVIWGLAVRSLGERPGRSLALLAICLQSVHAGSAGAPRWNAQPWTADMLPAQVPASLVREPHLMLTIGSSSESFVAGFVHPDSPFVNPIGMYSLPVEGAGWRHFVRLRDQWVGRTRVLFAAPSSADPALEQALKQTIHDMIDPLGLALDPKGCERLLFNAGTSPDPVKELKSRRHLFSCEAVAKPAADPDLARQRALAKQILDAFESRCARYLQPAGLQVVGSDGMWSRRYLRYDLFVQVDLQEGEIRYRQERQATPGILGRVDHWERDLQSFRCRLPHDGIRGVDTLRGDR